MKTKPTPGPWVPNIQWWPDGTLNGTPTIYAPNGGVVTRGLHVCWLYNNGNIDANARLIAAAPDLLEALKNALNVLDGVACGHLGTVQVESRAIKIARAAIAKAEGQE